MKFILFVSLLILLGFFHPKEKMYQRTYHENGTLASEGWLMMDAKDGYWKFYHENGSLSEQGNYKKNKRSGYWYFYKPNALPIQEGHFENNQKTDWWLFYDARGRIDHKCQLNKNLKDGYCLKYKNEKLMSIVRGKIFEGKKNQGKN